MKRIILTCIIAAFCIQSKAQSLKMDYFASVPTAMKNCGALYTYDSVSVDKNKFILAVDLQNQGLIRIAGKQVKLLLTDTKTVNQQNVMTYTGGGYTVILTAKMVKQVGRFDMEAGTIVVKKGTKTITLKIHGKSGCDESTQEGNS